MIEILNFALLAPTSIVAVMEPASTIAVYVTLTKDMDLEKHRRIISRSMIISFLILAFFALTGNLLFSIFNLTISAFEVAGSILLVIVALRMLSPRREEYSSEGREDLAIIPLAFPLTAGPGTITAVILLVSEANGFLDAFLFFVGIFAGILISYVGMRYSARMFRMLGDEGLRVITALMSIIVLAMAVQFVISGVAEALSQILGPKS